MYKWSHVYISLLEKLDLRKKEEELRNLETPNLLSSSNMSCVFCARFDLKQLGQAKVGDLGVHVCV
jgi:hypothetical protein